MKATITDVAEKSGVSVATVSHYLNKSRYVSPELQEKVEWAIQELHYEPSRITKNRAFLGITVGIIIPDGRNCFYSDLTKKISDLLYIEKGYIVEILESHGDVEEEEKLLKYLEADNKVIGIFLVEVPSKEKRALKLDTLKKPVVMIGNYLKSKKWDIVFWDYEEIYYHAATHFLKKGHDQIGICADSSSDAYKDYCRGYERAYREMRMKMPFAECAFDMEHISRYTGVLCENQEMLLRILKSAKEQQIKCPEDLSIIVMENLTWTDFYTSPITAFYIDSDMLVKKSCELMSRRIAKEEEASKSVYISFKCRMGSSTGVIGRREQGERRGKFKDITLREDEKIMLQNGKYSLALLFQYSGKRWMRLQEQAVLNVCNKLNIRFLGSFDAHSDAHLFESQMENVLSQNPDVILCAAAIEKHTGEIYKQLARQGRKFVFSGHIPKTLSPDEYICCVTPNDNESGYNCARFLGEYFKGKNAKIGLLCFNTTYIPGKVRDTSVEKSINNFYPNLKIVAKEYFNYREYAYDVCKKMVHQFPEIEGIYVTYEDAAIEVISALIDSDREDIKVVTGDLDTEVANNMAKNRQIIGISAQQPYVQGEALVYAAANALLGKTVPKVIEIPPIPVTGNNLADAWYTVTKDKLPASMGGQSGYN